MINKEFFLKIKPGVKKRCLLFIAALIWTFAGGMLLFRGFTFLFENTVHLWLRISLSLIGGVLFYLFLFSKISFKHTLRIRNLKEEHPCAFSFFNIKSYIMMFSMIFFGIILRKSGIVPVSVLSVIYVTMGIPLFLSSLRFYYAGFNYLRLNE
jgi:hypothetical protein